MLLGLGYWCLYDALTAQSIQVLIMTCAQRLTGKQYLLSEKIGGRLTDLISILFASLRMDSTAC